MIQDVGRNHRKTLMSNSLKPCFGFRKQDELEKPKMQRQEKVYQCIKEKAIKKREDKIDVYYADNDFKSIEY